MSEQPFQLIQKGTFNVVPTITGINHDENAMWVCPKYSGINDAQYQQILNTCYGTTIGPVISQFYPSSKYANPAAALVQSMSDGSFKCPSKQLAAGIAATGKADAFIYSFEHVGNDKCRGAMHSDELVYLWWASSMTGQDKTLSQTMRNAWATFAATGAPSFPGLNLQWKKFDKTTEAYVSFNSTSTANTGFLHDACQFWADLQTKFPQTDLQQISILCLFG